MNPTLSPTTGLRQNSVCEVKTDTREKIQAQFTELTRISLTPGIFARSGKSDSNQLCID